MSDSLIRVVISADPPLRLDKALARDVPDDAHLSRSRLARLLRDGAVRLDGVPVKDTKMRPEAGQVYDIHIPDDDPADMLADDIPLTIVYEDEDLVVIDKPAGMVVHPAPGSPNGTLVNALLHRYGDELSSVGGVARPGIVHRIDKETSGLLVVARTDRAHHALSAQFAAHTAERSYLALCHGVPDAGDPRVRGLKGVSAEPGGLRIATHLDRHPSDRQRQAVRDRGRHAVTHIAVERRFEAAGLVACRLETGRTHQIRVHMAYLGHPLIGDQVYGTRRRMAQGAPGADVANAFPRQALHAATLGFRHPDGRDLRFSSQIPEDMQGLLSALSR